MKMYRAVKINAVTLIPEIVDVDFVVKYHETLKGDWIYVTKGAVTGFESAELENLIQDYPKRSVFAYWVACGGTLNKYHRLEIPMSEVIKFLEDQKLIEVKREYGYVKKITRLSTQRVNET